MDLSRRKSGIRARFVLGRRAESSRASRTALWAVLWPSCGLLAICLFTGCESRKVELYPVRGKVLFEGQPAAGATLVLRPIPSSAPDNVFPRGTVKADGAFEVESYPLGRGAPAGDYVAVLTWFPPDARQLENPVNRLPDRYADEALSGLVVSVKPQPNELGPFELSR